LPATFASVTSIICVSVTRDPEAGFGAGSNAAIPASYVGPDTLPVHATRDVGPGVRTRRSVQRRSREHANGVDASRVNVTYTRTERESFPRHRRRTRERTERHAAVVRR
jgi:hypothetical protein